MAHPSEALSADAKARLLAARSWLDGALEGRVEPFLGFTAIHALTDKAECFQRGEMPVEGV